MGNEPSGLVKCFIVNWWVPNGPSSVGEFSTLEAAKAYAEEKKEQFPNVRINISPELGIEG
ncbi:MAG: hypothetical protein M0T84_09950 [Betaproteobacteria bacterium]|nr:hypothetical protein [Betaproteobacteria bacterium]MDA8383037.1 hypothetical protein [Betaproteobacteria bacterium]